MYHYTIELLKKLAIKYEVHVLQSEVRMVDVWHDDKFYVLQFEKGFIGFSDIDKDNPGFDTVPDEKFFDVEMFKRKLEVIFTITKGI